MEDYKPKGYNSLSPYLVVRGGQQMVNLLKQVFGGEELRRYDHENGSIVHAEIKIDDSVIMVADASDAWPANQTMLHVYVPDAKAVFAKAMDHGCKSLKAPIQEENDPDIRGLFEDFAGNQWAVSTQL